MKGKSLWFYRCLFSLMSSITTLYACPTFAQLSWGDKSSQTGAVSLSTTLRAKYQDTAYAYKTDDQKIKFDAALFNLNYTSTDTFADLEYRCYQYQTFCDFATLVSAYAGYNINSTDQITFGLQPVPFGPSRYWDSSFYASLNNTMGLQDVLNVGVNYHTELASHTQLDLAYFIRDGGHYQGESHDAARYSANFVDSLDPTQANLSEENMWIARVRQDLTALNNDHLKLSIGGSYWYSEIKDKHSNIDGQRNAWAVFGQMNYDDFAMILTGGQLDLQHQDHLKFSTLGAFDSEYYLANQGYFYTFDVRYQFKDVQDQFNVTPYLVLSGFDKTEKSFQNSERHIVGLAFDYKHTALYTEYVMSKNDPFIGGNKHSLAGGDHSSWNKLFNVTWIYHF